MLAGYLAACRTTLRYANGDSVAILCDQRGCDGAAGRELSAEPPKSSSPPGDGSFSFSKRALHAVLDRGTPYGDMYDVVAGV